MTKPASTPLSHLHDETILALDGGGTNTRAVLVTRQGHLAGSASGPGCNAFDRPEWAHNLRTLLTSLPHPRLQAAALGIAGYDVECASATAQDDVARAALGPSVALCLENDVQSAHRGAFAGEAGLFVLAGTGSVAMARNSHGQQARVGGWGWLLGDEGSGYWIGREALAQAARFLDNPAVAHAAFSAALLTRLGLPVTGPQAPFALHEWLRTRPHPRSAIGNLAPLIHTMAEEGQPQAMALLQAAGQELAQLARTAAHRCTLPCGPDLIWSHGGSVMHSHFVRNTLANALGAQPRPPVLPPLGGAALLAATLAGWHVDAPWIATLANALHHEKGDTP